MKKNTLDNMRAIALALFLSLGLSVAFAFNGPLSAPPPATGNTNTLGPVNVGSTQQVKTGPLWVGTLGVTSGLIVTAGNVGVGTGSVIPSTRLEINGGVKLANDSDACTATKAGTIRFTGTAFQGCDGTAWTALSSGSGGTSIPTSGVPGIPTITNITSGSTQTTLSWTAPDDGGITVGYRVYRGSSSGGETYLITLGNVLTYTNTGLTSGTAYYYKISAINSAGVEGTLSGEKVGYPGAKIIFASSATYTGDLGGLSGADQKCGALASAAGLSGTYKAWLSVLGTSASSRLSHSAYAYVDTLGQLIATNWADLTDGSIANPINIDENKTGPVYFDAYTGTDYRGMYYDDGIGNDFTCSGWTAAPSNGIGGWSGDMESTGFDWAGDGIGYCDAPNHLYCIQQ